MKQSIEKLNNKFEALKEKFSNDEIILVFAEFEIKDLLLESEIMLRKELSKNERKLVKSLNNQMKEFNQLIQDLSNNSSVSI